MNQEEKNNIIPPLMPELGKDGTKIDRESAEKSVDELLEHYHIEFENIVNYEGKEGAKTWKNKMIKAFQEGRLETYKDDDPEKGFCIIQNFSTGKSLTYKEYGFTAAVQSSKQKDPTTANLTLLASLAGNMVGFFSSKKNCSGPDLRLAEAVVTIFFF